MFITGNFIPCHAEQKKRRKRCMKDSFGTRTIDELGRVVLPVELRKKLGWNEKDEISVYHEKGSDSVTLKRTRIYETRCVFCGKPEKSITINGSDVCPECLRQIYIEGGI
jgi:transcriptional pleiotropic regulator of transition state genes